MESQKEAQVNERKDIAESFIHSIDHATKRVARTSIFHVLTFASIGASLALWFTGKRTEAIFVGLWPPTFEALKSAAERGAK